MSDFNYQEYLKNNPLLKEEVKEEKLLTESQEVEETVEETVEEVVEETTEEIQEEAPSSKMKVSELKAKIKEDILSLLQEEEDDREDDELSPEELAKKWNKLSNDQKLDLLLQAFENPDEADKHAGSPFLEEEDAEVEVEDEIEVDTEEPSTDIATDGAGLTTDEQEIQDSLKLAYDNAVAIGDQKLADQIGNSITFFTRTHVVER